MLTSDAGAKVVVLKKIPDILLMASHITPPFLLFLLHVLQELRARMPFLCLGDSL